MHGSARLQIITSNLLKLLLLLGTKCSLSYATSIPTLVSVAVLSAMSFFSGTQPRLARGTTDEFAH